MRTPFQSLLLAAGLTVGALLSGATTTLLSEADVAHLAAVLPPPPADATPAGLADLETLLQVQADRTPEQAARAARIVKHTPFQMGAAVFGPDFTERNLPRTAGLFALVWEEMHTANETLKRQWSRPRPSVRDPRVQPCVPVPENTSYPSGHSIHATVWAALFAEAFPEHAADFAAQARETRWARVLGGVHFPSDTQAGRLVGEEMARTLLASPAIHSALAAMRAEVLAARSSAAQP